MKEAYPIHKEVCLKHVLVVGSDGLDTKGRLLDRVYIEAIVGVRCLGAEMAFTRSHKAVL